MENRIEREGAELARGEYQPDGTIGADTYRSGFKAITDDLTMTIRDFAVEASPADVDITVTLPSVSEARGKIFTIQIIDSDTGDVYIDDAGDDPLWPTSTDVDLTTQNDFIIVFSNGRHWYELASTYS